LSDHQIRHLADTGALVTVFRGVYRLAGSSATFEQRCLGATYACGEHALVSHEAAAALRSLVPEPQDIAVTVPLVHRIECPGIVLHRSRVLDVPDRAMCGKVAVTSPARTLLDITPGLEDSRLELISDDAFRRGLLSPDGLVAYLERPVLANRPGIHRLRRVGRDRAVHGVPESKLETQIGRAHV
jgi:hypothetical protein